MSKIELFPHQKEALGKMGYGSILFGGTGSGKSLTALAFYYQTVLGGSLDKFNEPPRTRKLYVITTPRKRDDEDWIREASRLPIPPPTVIDSWNNVQKYKNVTDAFFIFDEHRVIGSGKWARAFIKIAKRNLWVILSATPADTWKDLATVFIARGYFRSRSEFNRKHVIFAPYVKYPAIRGYIGVPYLKALRDEIYVVMGNENNRTIHRESIFVEHYDDRLREFKKTQWNWEKDAPVKSFPEYAYLRRILVIMHPDRFSKAVELFEKHKKIILFYNYNKELDGLKNVFTPITTVSEYNGHSHDPIPTSEEWVYLVHYSSSEGWECFDTDTIVFFSSNPSYRTTIQAMGRINRLTTKYTDLYYYWLMSKSEIDVKIRRQFNKKRSFNLDSLKVQFKPPRE